LDVVSFLLRWPAGGIFPWSIADWLMDRTGGAGLDDRVWKNLSIVLGVICALLIGVAGALMIVGHKSGSPAGPSASPSLIADASATQTDNLATPSPTAATSPLASGSCAASACATGSPAPAGSRLGTPATIVFNGLQLDASTDKSGTARTFTFTSDGTGPLNLSVIKNSVGGSTRMCVKVDTAAAACKVGGLPSFSKAYADTAHSVWTVTLVGYAASKPTVDLSLTWPADAAKVTMSHGRFQGASVAESLNGLTATFKPRSGGTLNVQASWTAVTVDASMTLSDVTTPPAVTLDSRQYKATTYVNPPYVYNVDSTKTYLLKLRNASPDAQRPDLTAQISFP
jgi:hypothetical protein